MTCSRGICKGLWRHHARSHRGVALQRIATCDEQQVRLGCQQVPQKLIVGVWRRRADAWGRDDGVLRDVCPSQLAAEGGHLM